MTTPQLATKRTSCLLDRLIIPPTHLELIVVDHCNMSCKYCNHASPVLPAWFADPSTVYRDFSILAKCYRPKFIKVIGGEPLLHKQLAEVIRAARESGICDHFTLVTNGLLLDNVDTSLWNLIDEIELSIYPGSKTSSLQENVRKAKALSLGKKVKIYEYNQFRTTFCTQGCDDLNLISKIYAACKIANYWGCHAVRDGFFFKCPQSIYVPFLTGGKRNGDGLAISDNESFREDLLEFVNSPNPLSACRYCVGTAGLQKTTRQLPRRNWGDHIDKRLEEIVDFDWLQKSLQCKSHKDDCKRKVTFRLPQAVARQPLLQKFLSSQFSEFVAKMLFKQADSFKRNKNEVR